jgi:hypothetical protein
MCDFKEITSELNNKLKLIKQLTKEKTEIRNKKIYDENTRNKMCLTINDQIISSRDELTTIIQNYAGKALEK